MFLLHEGQHREAAHRFQYSLRKVPQHDYHNEETQKDFEDVEKCLTLNLVRCKANMNVITSFLENYF